MRRLEFTPEVRAWAAERAPIAGMMVVSLGAVLLALVIPISVRIPLAWGSLAFALLMMLITYWVASIPWIVTCAVMSFGAWSFFGMLMAISHQFGAMFAGLLAFGLVIAVTASRKRLRTGRQRGNT